MVIILNRLNDSTTPRAYTYNHFDQLTQVTNADGNRTPGKTTTGIWAAVYDAENRPMSFTNDLGIRFGLAAGGKFVEAFVEAGVTLSYTYDFNKEKGGWGTGWYARIVASTLFYEYQYKISEGSSEIDFE